MANRVGEILEAIQILSRSPLIGRPVAGGKRELIIGKGTRGYVALYRYLAEIETVFILASPARIRVQGLTDRPLLRALFGRVATEGV